MHVKKGNSRACSDFMKTTHVRMKKYDIALFSSYNYLSRYVINRISVYNFVFNKPIRVKVLTKLFFIVTKLMLQLYIRNKEVRTLVAKYIIDCIFEIRVVTLIHFGRSSLFLTFLRTNRSLSFSFPTEMTETCCTICDNRLIPGSILPVWIFDWKFLFFCLNINRSVHIQS